MNFRIPDFPLGALLATTLCVIGLLFISPEMPSMWLWEALIAISFIVWAIGAGFMPSKDSKDLEEIDSESRSEACQSQDMLSRSDISKDIDALIRVLKSEGRANRKEERKEDNEKRFREQITIVFIGITMFAIILQVHEMVKAYEPIHDQAKAAVDQAKAAIKQAEAATIEVQGSKDQAKAAQDAAVASGRAWVGPNGATMNVAPVAQQDSKITVSYQNTGKEPAIDFVDNADTFVVTNTQQSVVEGNNKISNNISACKAVEPIDQAQVVYPSTGFASNSLTVTVSKDKINQEVLNGTGEIVLNGCFAYKTFKGTHHSAFCFIYGKNFTTIPNLNFCPGGSYAD